MIVLMVDDNDLNLTVYRSALKSIDATDSVAFTASREALDWSRLNEIDVVLVDYNMPAPNGLQFIEEFRGIPGRGDVPIIMITGMEHLDIRYRALELGAADF